MDLHRTKISPETRLEETALGIRQRPSVAAWVFEALPHPLGSWSRFTMQLLLAFMTHALDAWWRTDSRIRHSYDLLRHTVGFLLKAVAWLVTVSLG